MERIRQAIEIEKAGRLQEPPRTGASRPAPPIEKSIERRLPGAPWPLSQPVSRDHLEAMHIVAFDARNPRTAHFDMLRT
jgi:hypothetical protein